MRLSSDERISVITSVPFLLADRTNGRTYATVLRLSSVCLSACDVMYCGAVRPRAKVTIDSL